MSTTFRIKHLSGSLAGRDQRIALSEGQAIRLGRGPENDVKFNAAVDDTVSGVHAELSWRDGRLTIEDQKSSNGTFVNGAPCPPFEKLAVPDGSRIRLGQEGPEMQVTFEAAAAGGPAAGAGDDDRAEPPPKKSVGRETLLREIDRAKQEERDHMIHEVDRSRKKTGVWLAAASVVLVALVAGGVWQATRSSAAKVEDSTRVLTKRIDGVRENVENVWSDVESRVRPAVGHVRVRYHLAFPEVVDGDIVGMNHRKPEIATGTAVLVGPSLVMTAKHVVAPWELIQFDAEGLENRFRGWKHFADVTGSKAVYDRLEIQFPGRQPIAAEVVAIGEVSDLALLSIPEMTMEPVDVESSNDAVDVTDEVGILGYPHALGAVETLAKDTTHAEASFKEVTDMEPTFIRGTVSRPVPEVGETSRYFFLDASIEPGNSGGPVLSREGKVIGIISSRRTARDTMKIHGQDVPVMKPVAAAGRAVGPSDIVDFLERAGVR